MFGLHVGEKISSTGVLLCKREPGDLPRSAPERVGSSPRRPASSGGVLRRLFRSLQTSDTVQVFSPWSPRLAPTFPPTFPPTRLKSTSQQQHVPQIFVQMLTHVKLAPAPANSVSEITIRSHSLQEGARMTHACQATGLRPLRLVLGPLIRWLRGRLDAVQHTLSSLEFRAEQPASLR